MSDNKQNVSTALAERLSSREDALRAALKEARAQFRNSTDKATITEQAFRKFVADHLPRKFGIGHGEVWDETGRISPQLDLVVASPEHPFTYNEVNPGMFFVEGVVAAAEVKAVLTSDGLKDCVSKGRKFKELTANFPIGSVVMTSESDLFRFGLHPPYWCFAYESQLTLENIESELRSAGSYVRDQSGNTLDAIFIMDRGAVIDFGDGTGSFACRMADGSNAKGWLRFEGSPVLLTMLGWLYAVMPPVQPSRSTLVKYLLPQI